MHFPSFSNKKQFLEYTIVAENFIITAKSWAKLEVSAHHVEFPLIFFYYIGIHNHTERAFYYLPNKKKQMKENLTYETYNLCLLLWEFVDLINDHNFWWPNWKIEKLTNIFNTFCQLQKRCWIDWSLTTLFMNLCFFPFFVYYTTYFPKTN